MQSIQSSARHLHALSARLLLLACFRHLIENVLLLILDQELRAALDVNKQAVHLANVFNVNLQGKVQGIQ